MYGETTFGPWLRQRRRLLDLTQADLARRVGCSEITIRKFEADERTPSRQIAELLADCLELPLDEHQAFIPFARGRQRDDAPAPAPAPAGCTHLPVPLTRLLGREQDVAVICRHLLRGDVRLLTLVGPPGIGKTRLSLQVAAELCGAPCESPRFAYGVAFVPLASVGDPGVVLDTIAQALGVSEAPDRPLLERLVEALRHRSLLLILDNFEHLLPAATDLSRLLIACPDLKILATSRAALHVRGEHLFPVAPLALPDLAWPLGAEAVARAPSVMLFVERAQAVAPHFALTAENAATVAAICARLDGLPLAIELVAARCRLLSPLAVLSRLGQRLTLLAGGPSDLPPRHQTLRSAIEWSYNLLAPAEQRLFERLGVLVGDYDLDAVEAIASELRIENGERIGSGYKGTVSSTMHPPLDFSILNSQFSILNLLEVLIDHSLVTRRPATHAEPRFAMLETIREYALERLAARGELGALRERHARYYLDLAEQAEPDLSGALQDVWLERLEREHDHFRAALAWSLRELRIENEELRMGVDEHAGSFSILNSQFSIRSEVGLRLGAALWRFWYIRCHLNEGRRWLRALLAAEGGGASAARARGLLGAGVLAGAQGDLAEARGLIEAGLADARRLGDGELLAAAAYHLGMVLFDQGEAGPAIAAIEESLRLQRARGDRAGIAGALNGLGNLLLGRDDPHAIALLEESVALQRALHNTRGIAFTLHSLGVASLQQQMYRCAFEHFGEARRLFRQLGDTIGIADCLAGLAAVAAGQGRRARGARLWRVAEELRAGIGAPMPDSEREIYARHLEEPWTLEARLGVGCGSAAACST